jgi:hypothetical protein
MKKYTLDELVKLGYKIENAKITSVDLTMADHGCITLSIGLDGQGWACCYGGYCLGHGYLGADNFDGNEKSMPYIMMIMDTIGVPRLNDMVGKYIRVATRGWGDIIKIIGNIIEDKWFDTESFLDGEE